jgi:hypothetical protein
MKLFNLAIGLLLLTALALVPTGSAMAAVATYSSCFQLQNLDAADAIITISFYAQGSATPTDVSDTILANGSKTYCPLSAVAAGFNGSVVISSTTQLAAIANVTGGSPAWSAYDASYGGFKSTQAAITVNLPLLMANNYGFNTWFNVQNAGGTGDAAVHVVYSDGTTHDQTIGVNQAKTFDQATETHSAAIFAATITSTQPIVVAVMEVGSSALPMLFGYNGFTSLTTTAPLMPLLMANNYGYNTGIQIQNVGGVSTNVTVAYTHSTGTSTDCTETHTIAAGASTTFALHAWDGTDAANNTCVNGETFIGSAKVTVNSASMGLVAIVNQQNFSTNKGAAYGSFDAAAATATVVFPLIMDRNYGYFTGFNVMNAGANDATVTCTFTSSGVTVGPTLLTPGKALTHTQLNQLGNGYVGAATCIATGTDPKIVGVVNQLLNSGTADTFLVYEGFNK